ncbi:MAG: dipeptidyl carboxypeptidase II, partial [Alphaproteobacteria bacterium]|nr:dipeptidyl carboxypeptidase II [Alphaproteobacteria bacterium]
MHRTKVLLLGAVATTALALTACSTTPPTAPVAVAPARENPFAKPSTLPLEAPPFDQIKDTDYGPAIEEGMKQQIVEIDAIANSSEAPTFENTIVALEVSGAMLTRAANAFFAVVQANTNDTLDKTQTELAPKLAAHSDAIFLNPKLFARVKAIYDQRDKLNLDPESLQLLKVNYEGFVHAGALLSEADKVRLREINQKDAALETSFQQKLVAGAKAGALVVDDKADLAGLTDGEIAAAAQAAEERGLKGKYVLPLQNTTQQPKLISLTNRETREKLFNNSWTRTEKGDENDTRAIISEIAQLRAEKAKLLGYPSYADYALYDQMAKTPQAVEKFLGQLVPATAKKAAAEAREIQKMIDKSGKHFDLKPWDWQLYAEKVRKAKYDLDESELKPYFELNNVLINGVFYAATQLYGITFKERHDLPVY